MDGWALLGYAAAIAILLAAATAFAAEPVLTREPPRGELRQGQCVLVDDGACKKGEIKRLCAGEGYSPYGGNHGNPRKRRTRTCVARTK